MNKINIVMFDNEKREHTEYMQGIQEGNSGKWQAKVCIANGPQKNKLDTLIRYFRYFYFPFLLFLQRKKFNVVIGWQSFYATNFAFYCRLFHVKKVNRIVIQHLVYKPKKGKLGILYEKYIKYAVNNEYVDLIQTDADGYIDYIHTYLGVPKEKIVHVPFGVNDFTCWEESNKEIQEKDYVLAIGRSNRDWKYVIDVFKNVEQKLIVICDQLKEEKISENIQVLHVNGLDSLPYFKNSMCSIYAVENGALSSGETVFAQSLCYGKPAIIIRPCGLETDYCKDGYNGYVMDRNLDALKSILNQLSDPETYHALSENCRKDYEENYSLRIHAKHVGEIVQKFI